MINWKRIAVVVSVHLFSLLMFTLQAYAGGITVNPGKFDRFIISLPERIQAGEEAQINIQAADNLGNIIKGFNTQEKEFVINATGSATLNTKTLKSSAFSSGVATVIFRNTIAEKCVLSIRETNNLIPLITKEIVVLPASLKSFNLRAPKTSRAGEKFDVALTARDQFGNIFTDVIPGKNINFTFKGDADVKFDMPVVPDVVNGISTVSFMSMKTGAVVIEAKDVMTGSYGVSDAIEIINGNVNSFKVMAAKETVAGEPFEVSIAAIDRFGNFVTDYSANGKGINIKSSGKTVPFPSTVPAYEFVKGQARVSLRYDAAENIILSVTEIGGNQTGSTEAISVTLPKADRFEIIAPDAVVAGQKFKIKITVYNQSNRVIRNYNLIGSDVALKTSGTGVLMPDRIPPSEFINGTAIVEVQYNKAESFNISASEAERSADDRAIAETPSAKEPKATSPAVHSKPVSKKQQKSIKKSSSMRYEVTNLSIVESKKMSTLTVHINGMSDALSYSVLTDKGSNGKKVLILKIKSASSRVDKNLNFDSGFIKNILVEEDGKEDGSVLVKMEQIRNARFHVTKGKGSLSIVFTK